MLDLIRLDRLDPHFTKVIPEDGIEIIARFPPSEKGIKHATRLANTLQDDEDRYDEI
jgi:hypothetical protein